MEDKEIIQEVERRLPKEVTDKIWLYKGSHDEISNTLNLVIDTICDVIAEGIIKGEVEMVYDGDIPRITEEWFGIPIYVSPYKFQHAIYDRVKDYDFDFWYPIDEDESGWEINDFSIMVFYNTKMEKHSRTLSPINTVHT